MRASSFARRPGLSSVPGASRASWSCALRPCRWATSSCFAASNRGLRRCPRRSQALPRRLRIRWSAQEPSRGARRDSLRRRPLARALHALEIDFDAAMRADDRTLAEIVAAAAAGLALALGSELGLAHDILRATGRAPARRGDSRTCRARRVLRDKPDPSSSIRRTLFKFSLQHGGRANLSARRSHLQRA